MDEVRAQVALPALRSLPPRAQGVVSPARLVAEDGGHALGKGVHIGWAWGTDTSRGVYLDFLWEHRMPGITAGRFWQDGEREPIPAPDLLRVASADPEEDARLEREYVEESRRRYADLRERGLLPPVGDNLGSYDVDEHLRTRASGHGGGGAGAGAADQKLLVLRDQDDDGGVSRREVALLDDGGLSITGQDLGGVTERYWGQYEYEFSRRLTAAEVSRLLDLLDIDDRTDLLARIAERFPESGALEAFLVQNDLPGEFWSRIGD